MIKTAIKAAVPGIQRVVKCNDVYKHYKGYIYRVITVAKDTELEEDRVIYYDVMKPEEKDKPWDRLLSMFNDYVVVDQRLPSVDQRLPSVDQRLPLVEGSAKDSEKLVLRFEQYILPTEPNTIHGEQCIISTELDIYPY